MALCCLELAGSGDWPCAGFNLAGLLGTYDDNSFADASMFC